MVDPASAYIIAHVCVAGLKLAIGGLKGLFKRIRNWWRRKFKLREFIDIINKNELLETRKIADYLVASPEAMRHAQNYAIRVQHHRDLRRLANVSDVTVDESSYETGDEWEGESCPGSPIDESDWEKDSNSDSPDDDSPPPDDDSPPPDDDSSSPDDDSPLNSDSDSD